MPGKVLKASLYFIYGFMKTLPHNKWGGDEKHKRKPELGDANQKNTRNVENNVKRENWEWESRDMETPKP